MGECTRMQVNGMLLTQSVQIILILLTQTGRFHRSKVSSPNYNRVQPSPQKTYCFVIIRHVVFIKTELPLFMRYDWNEVFLLENAVNEGENTQVVALSSI